ncbi:MAG: hypothetical protein HFG29_02645 [Eubacterium sp.]|nr:hypothetical protein [Eubacterium sp.]
MFKRDLLDKLFIEDQRGINYICFSHSNKVWLMPHDNFEPALEMYQPSTMKGKVLKSCIKLFHTNKKILHKFGCEKKKLSLNVDILSYLQKTTNEKNIYIAAYMGDTTTKQNNKTTLQVYNNQGILCYVKISEEPEVLENFSREMNSLKYLEEKGITNIPKVLGDEQIHGLRIFVQSTNKPLKQQVRLEFGTRQVEFIDNIVKKTKKDVRYETSQFYDSVQYLKSTVVQFGDKEQSVIKTAIRQVETYVAEKDIEFAFSHGDYTPWNVYYVEGELSAFDFEYCYDTMPCYIDVFHYFTQFSIMGQHNDVEKTSVLYQQNKKFLKKYISSPDMVYICYLLHVIAFYHNRTNGKMELIGNQVQIWIGLLERFVVFKNIE